MKTKKMVLLLVITGTVLTGFVGCGNIQKTAVSAADNVARLENATGQKSVRFDRQIIGQAYPEGDNTGKQVIGYAESAGRMSPIPANLLIVDWKATQTQIFILVKNTGFDSVDKFAGTVVVHGERGSSTSFSASNLKPFVTITITVNVNMLRCYEEDITVSFYAIDDGYESGSSSISGYREIPAQCTALWNQGSFPTLYRSIDKHFEDHEAEVGATNLMDYVLKAISYRGQVISDIAKLTESALKAKYTVTDSPRPTPGTKYKNNNDGRFIILADLGQGILSFGI